MNCEIRAIF